MILSRCCANSSMVSSTGQTGARQNSLFASHMESCLLISSIIMISMNSSRSPNTRIMISLISTLARWKVPTNGLNMNLDHLYPFVGTFHLAKVDIEDIIILVFGERDE